MEFREEYDKLVDRLKTERDELKLKMHLGSMEVKGEFEEAEKKWQLLKSKTLEIAEGASDASDELRVSARKIGEELKVAYRRISDRLFK